MDKIGKKLKNLRTDNAMTQATLAKKLNLTKSVISAYENDLRLPSYDVLIQIAGNGFPMLVKNELSSGSVPLSETTA